MFQFSTLCWAFGNHLNIYRKSHTTVKYGVKTLASFMDCIIFLYLGIVTIKHQKEWHTGFVLWTIVLCTVVRLVKHNLLPEERSDVY